QGPPATGPAALAPLIHPGRPTGREAAAARPGPGRSRPGAAYCDATAGHRDRRTPATAVRGPPPPAAAATCGRGLMRRPLLGRVAVVAALAVVAAPVPARVAAADQVRDAQWHLDYLDLPTAHQLTRGAGVTVAVIDSGVDATHQDLTGNVL